MSDSVTPIKYNYKIVSASPCLGRSQQFPFRRARLKPPSLSTCQKAFTLKYSGCSSEEQMHTRCQDVLIHALEERPVCCWLTCGDVLFVKGLLEHYFNFQISQCTALVVKVHFNKSSTSYINNTVFKHPNEQRENSNK